VRAVLIDPTLEQKMKAIHNVTRTLTNDLIHAHIIANFDETIHPRVCK